jgi:hypothetical protein
MRLSPFRMLIGLCLGGLLLSCQPPPDEDIETVDAAAIAAGNYLLTNVNSAKCADVEGGSLLDGANVLQWTCHGQTNQQWTAKDLGTGYYELRNVNSGKCLDVFQASTADGANVDQWSCNGHSSQQWKFVAVSSGVYELRPRNSGKCLDVKGASLLDGANIQQYSCRGVNQQRWRISSAAGTAPPPSPSPSPSPSPGTVTFQNAGTTSGWDRVYAQRNGTITQIASPVYKGASALRMTQTYITSDGLNYHSEVVKGNTASTGQDRYFGQAVMLPGDWVWHNQNVTFQQWAPDDNTGPWLLMFVQGDHLWAGGRAFSVHDFGAISKGTWLRIVTRIKLGTSGVFEVWVDGTKRGTVTGDFTVSGGSIRWSSGIYCTTWDTNAPAGQSVLSIFHDHFRVATTYAAADPAGWN